MATLNADEMNRIKLEVGDTVMGYGAVAHFGVRSIYDVIRDNVSSSSVAATTSTTTVSAAGPTTITLASATGYEAGQRLVLDVDDARETVTLRSLSGASASVVCTKTHSGTYPVEVESALTLVRGILSDLVTLEQQGRSMVGSVGIKRVDEVEWFGASEGGSPLVQLQHRRSALRMELAELCGIGWIYREVLSRRSGGGSFEVY